VKIDFRWLPFAALAVLFVACHSSVEDKEAVKRGVLERLRAADLSPQNMDVDVVNVQFHGSKAEADVEIRPKGATHEQGMQMHYGLENQNGKWVVVSRADTAGHGSAIVPGSANPHGGAMPPDAMPPGAIAPDHGPMPAPQDLPPAGKKQ
jgi:hypothetical protein